MTALTHWDTLREMDELQRRMSSLLDWGNLRRSNHATEQEEITVPQGAPLVDIAEDEKEYLIKVELPEVQKKDLNVRVEDGTLIITGERKAEKEEKKRKHHRTERFHGRFERRFSIPENADHTKVNAEFKDGVLRVHLAKSESARPKQIDVRVE